MRGAGGSSSPTIHLHLAISDSVEEGKWLITAGPRKGQLFWDHSVGRATVRVRRVPVGVHRDDFWFYASSSWKQPDGGTGGADYARY